MNGRLYPFAPWGIIAYVKIFKRLFGGFFATVAEHLRSLSLHIHTFVLEVFTYCLAYLFPR